MTNITLLDLPTSHLLSNLLLHTLQQQDFDVEALIKAVPDKSFDNADTAWIALQEVIDLLDNAVRVSDTALTRYARARFYRNNLAELYLREAEDYRLFWIMELPEKVRVAINRTTHPGIEHNVRHEAIEMAKQGLMLAVNNPLASKMIYRKGKDFKDITRGQATTESERGQ